MVKPQTGVNVEEVVVEVREEPWRIDGESFALTGENGEHSLDTV